MFSLELRLQDGNYHAPVSSKTKLFDLFKRLPMHLSFVRTDFHIFHVAKEDYASIANSPVEIRLIRERRKIYGGRAVPVRRLLDQLESPWTDIARAWHSLPKRLALLFRGERAHA